MHLLKLKSQHIKLNKTNRLYNLEIPIIGLTGGIATGKSTVSKLLRDKGANVIDADALVHEIYQAKETFNFIQNLVPDAIKNEKIDFPTLRKSFFNNTKIQKEIEQHLYQRLPHHFLNKITSQDSFVVYDVPLLFEKGLEKLIDISVVVYCDRKTQISRLIKRDEISTDLAAQILDKQLPIDEKKVKADLVLLNNKDFNSLENNFHKILSSLFE